MIRLPPGADWRIWRLVFSDKIAETKHEIETTWTMDDVMDAHDILDQIEAAERKAYR